MYIYIYIYVYIYIYIYIWREREREGRAPHPNLKIVKLGLHPQTRPTRPGRGLSELPKMIHLLTPTHPFNNTSNNHSYNRDPYYLNNGYNRDRKIIIRTIIVFITQRGRRAAQGRGHGRSPASLPTSGRTASGGNTHKHTYIYIYIYMYIDRERERGLYISLSLPLSLVIYIYIYT